MATSSSLTLAYDSLLSSTLFNYRKTLEDNVTDEFIIYYMIKQGGGWKEVSDVGERSAFPLLYELGSPDSYDGYGQLDVTPTNGITTAFYDWRQAAVPIAISGKEEIMNKGEARIINLLKAKIMQAEMGMKEWWSKAFLHGDGMNGNSIITPRVSPSNASSFIDPLGLLVKYDPTTGTDIGNITQTDTNADGETWWANKTKAANGATTFLKFRQALRELYNDTSKRVGGRPNLHICDQVTSEIYEQALEAMHQNPSYTKTDLPFDVLVFKGKPLKWEENMIDPYTDAVNTSTAGAWYMLNTPMLGVKVVKDRNFVTTPFQKPENQDAKVAHILWMGAAGTYNRGKQGVMGRIPRTLTAS